MFTVQYVNIKELQPYVEKTCFIVFLNQRSEFLLAYEIDINFFIGMNIDISYFLLIKWLLCTTNLKTLEALEKKFFTILTATWRLHDTSVHPYMIYGIEVGLNSCRTQMAWLERSIELYFESVTFVIFIMEILLPFWSF